MPWFALLVFSVASLVACWAILLVAARTLPQGLLRDLAEFLPLCASTMWRLRRDPRIPRRVKVVLIGAGVWVLSPVDLIPEFVPVIGPLDDIVVVALALRYAARRSPRDVLEAAWPGDPRLLARLLGR